MPRTPWEKIADAAQVHAFTGVSPTVALHIPGELSDPEASSITERIGRLEAELAAAEKSESAVSAET